MTQPKQPNDAEKEQRLNAIIAEYLKRKDAGQNVSKDSMLKAFPELADGLRSYFQNEVMIGENVPALAATKLSPISPATDVRETLKPGAALADTASEFGNRKFGRYQILRPLGEGAMGSVYLALDTTLDRQVALKVPKTEGTANAEFMARFTREAKAAAGLKHANICRVYDAGEHEGTAYITMDFIDGVPLSRFIGTEKLQSVDSILQMILTIADAVGHAHSKGVIHRDLKPGNILVDADLKPHVTDFGLARRAGGPADESRITQEGLLIGTPAYMAPEQVKGEQSKVGPQSDIYSLGVILFELLTHRLPFEGKVPEMLAKVLRDAPPVPSQIRKDLSEEVDDLCSKMLQKSPEHRFASISELTMKLEALRNKFREASVPSNQPTARQKSPFEIQKAHIELMLKKGQYAAAIQDLEKLAVETSPGANAAAGWAKAKLPTVKKEAKALSPAGLDALLKTAQQMFQKSDYVGCAQLIEDIPLLRRTEAMEDLLDKSKRREAEADQLLLAIKDKEGRQDVDGLELLVKKLLKLKPGNAYARRLSETLQSYSKTPPTRRKYRYEKGRLQPMPEPSFLRQWAVLGSLVGILVFLSVYSYVIFYLKSGNQTLAVHVDDEWLKSQGGEVTLVVDGNNHTIATPKTGGDPVTITVSLGQHTFSVKHGDSIVHDPKTFEIEKDGRRVLQITRTDLNLVGQLQQSPSIVKTEGMAKTAPTKEEDQLSTSIGVTPSAVRALSELNDGPFDAAAWVSSDGLRIYWEHRETSAGAGTIWQAERSSPALPFENKRPLMTGGHPTFTADELQVVYVNSLASGPKRLCTASRKSVSDSFGSEQEIVVDGFAGFNSPWLSADGLTLFVNAKRGQENESTEYITLHRAARADAWGAPQMLNLKWDAAAMGTPLSWISISNDELSFLATHEQQLGQFRVVRFTRETRQQPFEKFEYLSLPGLPTVFGRTPRYVEATRELFVTAPAGYPTGGSIEPWTNDYKAELWVCPDVTLNRPDGAMTDVSDDKINVTHGGSAADLESTKFNLPAVAPFNSEDAKQYQEAWASELKLPVEYTNSIGMKFRLIPPGRYQIGSTPQEVEAAKPELTDYQRDGTDRKPRADSESPQQLVTLTRPFYLGTTEVTQEQYEKVLKVNPSRWKEEGPGNRLLAPVEMVSWMNAGEFCNRLSTEEALEWAYRITPQIITQTGVGGYRLPTEAEWEFACRAGTTTLYFTGDDPKQLSRVAWFENSEGETSKPVGQKSPNAFGLYDMHGNVFEWVHDAWRPDWYSALTGVNAIDPRCDMGVESRRVIRGGNYGLSVAECRSASRDAYAADSSWWETGFRVALSVEAVRDLKSVGR